MLHPTRRTAALIRRVSRRCAAAGLLVLTAAWSCASLAAPKTDVLVFVNGDRLTGEVKGLERGKLSFKTDATGTISIEWDKIASLETKQFLQVEMANGLRYFGQAPAADSTGKLRITVDEESRGSQLPLAEVVRIDTIGQGGVISRLDGYLTAGYNYTKADKLQQLNFTAGLKSRNEKREWSLDGSTTITSQEGQNDTSRYEVTAVGRRFLPERWFLQAFGGFEGNDELGLDLRTTLGGAYGRYLAQTNHNEWATYAGLAYSRENYVGRDQQDSLEAVLGTTYSFFRYDTPEASLDFTLNLLPSLTQSGRFRSEGKLRSRYEIVKDLFFEVSLYGSYDNKPGEEAVSTSDYGLTTSLGYSF